VRCGWVTPVLGVEGNLLYFGPLLREFARRFKTFTVFTGEYRGSREAAGFDISLCGRFKRLYKNERFSEVQSGHYPSGISITMPVVLWKLVKEKPGLLIINEFSLFSFYSVLLKLFRPGTRVLCIVESRPRLDDKPLFRILRRQFRRFIACFSDAFLTNNQAGLDYISDELGADKKVIIARPYLVSDFGRSRQLCSERPESSGSLQILYVGQLVKRKGLQFAIEALASLVSRYQHRFVFNIVGDGPYKDTLEQLVNKHALGDHVVFHGRQSYEDLPKFYTQNDVFLFPTLNDYRALTPFEALAFGLPILASIHDGGITETVIEGKNGFSFDPSHPGEIAEKLQILLDDPEKIGDFAKSSLEIAQSYTLDAAMDSLMSACQLTLYGASNSN